MPSNARAATIRASVPWPGRDRATASVVGVVLLVAIAVLSAAALASGLLGADALAPADPSRAVLDASANATADRVTLVHRGGDALDVTDLRIHVTVDGEPLAHQPPVPFFAAEGFAPGPTGPFNVAGDDRWTAGERASFALAGTNAPLLAPGARVTVRVYSDGLKVAQLRATAQ